MRPFRSYYAILAFLALLGVGEEEAREMTAGAVREMARGRTP